MSKELQTCEGCEKQFDIEIMAIDEDANWWCPSCVIYEDDLTEDELKELRDEN